MLSLIWIGLIIGGLIVSAGTGHADQFTQSLFTGAEQALGTAIKLTAVICVWLGISKVAEKAGLISLVARGLTPLLRWLFPDLPKSHPALAAIGLNISANVLGLSHAATPFGLKAMQELQALNPSQDTANPAMITFLVLNSAVISLVPAGAVAFRAAAHAASPTDIILPSILVTAFSCVVALTANYFYRQSNHGLPPRRRK
ncbi:MAG: nucleoside recognition domain-containing protein [Bacillota bacterium]